MNDAPLNHGLPLTIQVEFSKKNLEMLEQLINKCLVAHGKERNEDRFLSPAEAGRLFVPPVSVQTLSNWSKKGLISKHYVGAKAFFRYSDIIAATKTLKRYGPRNNTEN